MASHDIPAADYLKSEEIGKVIARGCAMLYQAKPANPVDYLGKWLLNVSQMHKLNVAHQYKMATVRAA